MVDLKKYLNEELTLDKVNEILNEIGNTIIDKKAIEKYSTFTEYNHQLNEMLLIKDSLGYLNKSYGNLLHKVNNTSYDGQLEDLNRTLINCKLEIVSIENKLEHYSKLHEICEFLDENETITLSNINYCADFIKNKTLLPTKDENESYLIFKRFEVFENAVNQYLIGYFANIIEISHNDSIWITVKKKDNDEFVRLLGHLDSEENVIERLDKKLKEFLTLCIRNPKKTILQIEQSNESISLGFKTQINNSNECILQNISRYVEFVYKNFPHLDLKNKLIHNLTKEITTECSQMCLNNSSNRMKKHLNELTKYLETIQREKSIEKYEEFFFSSHDEPTINNESTELYLLDSIRLIFTQENFFTSTTTFDKVVAFNELLPSTDNPEEADIYEVDHPEYWKNLLKGSILLGDYSTASHVHMFAVDFIQLIGKFYFTQKNNFSSKFETLRNAYKLFVFMLKHKLNKLQDQLSFSLFYNDLQILNYLSMVITLDLSSNVANSENLLSLGDFLIDFDDIFRHVIVSVLQYYNQHLIGSISQLELDFINSSVQKRNSNALHQVKESFRNFSFKHKNLLEDTVFEKYMAILINNVADVVTTKILELSDIPEKNIPIIEKLIGDLMDCFVVYGLDLNCDEKLSTIPAVAQLKGIMKILNSNLCMISQMWSDDNKNLLQSYLSKHQLIKLIESIFQDSIIRAGVIDKIKNE